MLANARIYLEYKKLYFMYNEKIFANAQIYSHYIFIIYYTTR